MELTKKKHDSINGEDMGKNDDKPVHIVRSENPTIQ